MATVPLETNPWFAYMVARGKVSEKAMVAIALKWTREFWVTPVGKCGKGHPLYLHPFASDAKQGLMVHMCPACQTASLLEAKANQPVPDTNSEQLALL